MLYYRSGQVGEPCAIETEGRFVNRFTKTVNIRCRRARTFRRNVTRCAQGRCIAASLRAGDKADICKLRHAVHEDNVRRFYVAVNEAVLMQKVERGRQVDT